MTHTPVTSSAIKSVAYDPITKIMHVTMRSNGKTYEYPGVTPQAHTEFMAAPSMGRHLAKIRSKFQTL